MRLRPQEARALYAGGGKRAAVRDTRRLWARGQAFYVIDRSLGKLLSIKAIKNQRDVSRNEAI